MYWSIVIIITDVLNRCESFPSRSDGFQLDQGEAAGC